jgi:hypothetical protein
MGEEIIGRLRKSREPSVRYKLRTLVLGESMSSVEIKQLRKMIKRSSRVRSLLQLRNEDGRLKPVRHVYRKWWGAHWILASLADIGYPEDDKQLSPAIQQVLDFWLQPVFTESVVRETSQPAYKDKAVPIINGRARRCASQQGNALFAALALGYRDERVEQLVELLLRWQWPDGGWNCDRKPSSSHSSFWEYLLPLRGLALYTRKYDSKKTARAVRHAAELFLRKELFKRENTGAVMNHQFLKLHYPCYWRYDILFGLKVMAESGFIRDRRCQGALDILEQKRLPDGGWPAEERFYQNRNEKKSNYDLVDWSGVSKRESNEWVTVDVLYVLKEAGRLKM